MPRVLVQTRSVAIRDLRPYWVRLLGCVQQSLFSCAAELCSKGDKYDPLYSMVLHLFEYKFYGIPLTRFIQSQVCRRTERRQRVLFVVQREIQNRAMSYYHVTHKSDDRVMWFRQQGNRNHTDLHSIVWRITSDSTFSVDWRKHSTVSTQTSYQ